MPDIYNYKKSVDNKIVSAVEQVLMTKVVQSKKMANGEINYVYKIITDKNTVIARVFRYADQPAEGMLLWIEKQLSKNNIPHAKLLYYSRDNIFFPNGFMVSEFVEGLNGSQDLDAGVHTLTESYEQSGKILKKIHQIKAKRYGKINYGKGEYEDYVEMELMQVKEKISDLAKRKALPASITIQVDEVIRTCLEPFRKTFRPVLIHGDASRENSIWVKGKSFILVDWDNAAFSIWMRDFIEYSWWWLHLNEWKSEEKRKIARTAFFKGYGKVEYTPKEIDTIQHGLLLIKSVEKLHYYLLDKKDIKNFNLVKKVFLNLLRKTI
jgi:Ser/Thr protein kinase RdoA (MazF antagonist)